MSNFDNWTCLSEYSLGRRKFDPTTNADLKELAYFKKFNKWRNGCPFYLEWPYKDIVSMCQGRYTDHMLQKLLKLAK